MLIRHPFRHSGRGIRHLFPTSFLVLSLLLLASPHPTASARAEDPCPEPNDEFQQACSLNPAATSTTELTGFIETAEDVDAYRLDTLDDNVMARVEITGAPGPYAFIIGDWNGKPVGVSSPTATGAAIDVALPVLGSYYVFVQSPDRTSSTTIPYRLGVTLTYPYLDGLKPRVLASGYVPIDEEPGWQKQIPAGAGGDDADFIHIGGRYLISVNKPGITADWPRVASPAFGPDASDFVMTADARACDQDDAAGYAGYRIGFRMQDPYHQYSVVVNVEGRRAWLNKVDGTSMKDTVELSPPTRSLFIDNKGGVNRTTIRAVGNSIRVSVNGGEIINLTDSTFTRGRFNFVAAAWNKARPLATFDNVMITTPSGGSAGVPAIDPDPRGRQGDDNPPACKPG